MILEHVVLPVIPGRESAFLEAFGQARPLISGQPGFVDLALHRGIERPHEFLLLVRWDSVAAHQDGFRTSPEYQEWKALLHHFYDPFPEVVHFVPEPVAVEATAAASLDDVRAGVDALDRQVIGLIAQRQQYVERAGELKRGQTTDAVRAPARVEEVIAKVRARAEAAGASADVVEATYRAMIGAFVDLELGVHGGMPEPLTHTESVHIAAPPHVVYAAVSDVTRTGEWSPVCRECWWDEGDGPWVGASFTGRNVTEARTWETRCEVIVADTDKAFGWSVTDGNVEWVYRLAEADGGTELTESWVFTAKGQEFFRERFGASAAEEIAARATAARAGIPATLAAIKQAIEEPANGARH